MKPSIFKKITSEISDAQSELFNMKRNIDNCDFKRLTELKNIIDALQKDLDECETVFVSYSIGSRGYNEQAYKVGKFYYTVATMTKLTSYYNPQEIPEITDEMRAERLADSYYY